MKPVRFIPQRLSLTTFVLLTSFGLAFQTGCAHRSPDGRRGRASSANLSSFSEAERERIEPIQAIVQRASRKYGVETHLINGLIWVESRFQIKAKSPAGARGLMQLMPATAKSIAPEIGFRRARPYDPNFNVMAGTYYLSKMLKRFDGNTKYALAAYNAGPGNVSKWTKRSRRLPKSAQGFVDKVYEASRRFE